MHITYIYRYRFCTSYTNVKIYIYKNKTFIYLKVILRFLPNLQRLNQVVGSHHVQGVNQCEKKLNHCVFFKSTFFLYIFLQITILNILNHCISWKTLKPKLLNSVNCSILFSLISDLDITNIYNGKIKKTKK